MAAKGVHKKKKKKLGEMTDEGFWLAIIWMAKK